jgi:Xaa-Pro aminopeptidase
MSATEAVLIFGTPGNEPALRHEVPISMWDPSLYIETGDRRILVTPFELHLVEAAVPDLELVAFDELGRAELAAEGNGRHRIDLLVAERACRRFGVTSARVPPSFPVEVADHLRRAGIELISDRDGFTARRRPKTSVELQGIRKALRAGEAAMAVAAALLDGATGAAPVMSGGRPLTCEQIRSEIVKECARHGTTVEDIVVAHGVQTSIGHNLGEGEIAAGEPVLIDFCPFDTDSKCFADISRTFVIGDPEPELVEYHRACREARALAAREIRPGADGRDIYEAVCRLFADSGYGSTFSNDPPAEAGFNHGLGHGIGLEVIEPPWIRAESWKLVEGDVMAIEPGLYREGFGGCRIEDLVLVTSSGSEVLTTFTHDLAPRAR